jgi:signal transducer and activator of transcription 5B
MLQGREPFKVPDSVPWPALAEQLSTKFEQATGRGLTKDDLDYLASKVLGG